MEKCLKPKEYYEDLYDRITIDFCRGIELRPHKLKEYKLVRKNNKPDCFL